MKKFLTGIVAMTALCVGTAYADDLAITYSDPTDNEYIGLTGKIEYRTGANEYGLSFPNFYIQYKTHNSTQFPAPDLGQKLFKDGTISVAVTGPNDFTTSTSCSAGSLNFPIADSHAWCELPDMLSVGGTYTLTATVSLNYVDESKGTETVVFTGTFEVPVREPKLTLDARLANSQGNSATIEYNANTVNLDGEVAYAIALYDNLIQEGEPVKTSTAAQGAFEIEAVPETHYDYSVKATVVGGKTTLTDVKTFSWTQTGLRPSISYTLEPTTEGTKFNYEVSYGDYAEEDVVKVNVYLLKAGEQPENASFKGEGKTGSIDCAFDGNDINVWVRAYLTVKDGEETKEISTSNNDFNINLKKKEVEKPKVAKLEVGEFTRTGAQSGTLPYTITMEEGADICLVDHFVVWASRVGDENMNVTVAGKDLTGVLNLTVLPENAVTGIWPKVKIIYVGGGESDAVQTNCTISTVDENAPAIEAPTTVPTPTEPNTNVVSLFSGVYEAATPFNIGQWGSSTGTSLETIGNAPVYHYTTFNYIGWEFTNHINVEENECNYMHVDYYPVKGSKIGFTPISPGNEKAYVADVTPGEWNSFNVPLSYFDNVDMTDLYQVKFDQGDGSFEGYVANVYFYKGEGGSSGPVTPPADGWAYYDASFEGISKVTNEADKPYTVYAEVLYHDDGTVTTRLTFNFSDGKPTGMVPWAKVFLTDATYGEKNYDLSEVTPEVVAYAEDNSVTEVYEGTTEHTYDDGTKISARFIRPFAGDQIAHNIVDNVTLVRKAYPVEVKEIEVEAAEEAEPVYFTLQGVRVENPAQGLYIRVSGQKVDKVMIK